MFKPKLANSQLLNYYIGKLGARYLGGYDFYLDTAVAKRIVREVQLEG